MYGLPVIGTCSQSASPSDFSALGFSAPGSSSDSNSNDQPQQGNTEMLPSLPLQETALLLQQTISLTAKQFTAMMTRMRTLEATVTQLNVSASQFQLQTHDNLLRSNLKPKMPNVYTSKSHKKLYEFLQQCVEHFEALNYEVNYLFSITFAASLFCGNTTGLMWVDYQSSLALGHIMTWNEFKKILCDDLRDKDAFIHKTWIKFFSYHQHAHKLVQSFNTTLHQLHSIFQEYNSFLSLSKSLMICCL